MECGSEGSLHWQPSIADFAGSNETCIVDDSAARAIGFTIIAQHNALLGRLECRVLHLVGWWRML
jgi:hypothetical protein